MTQPRIAITMGDVAGIGPEVVARACSDARVTNICRPVIVGNLDVLNRALRLVGQQRQLSPISGPDDHAAVDGRLSCWDPAGADAVSVEPGRLDARAGNAAYQYLVAATRATLDGQFNAIVTAPLNKAALHMAGHHYPGHTEIIAELCGVDDFGMMLYLPSSPRVLSPYGLGVAHVTLHTSIASVPSLLSTDGVQKKIELIDAFARRVGSPAPRIAVCALNPHAGEEGLFGDEESRVIAPAVATARGRGVNVVGPFPADTLLRRAIQGEFDGVVAMYHDQGHIAFKLIGQDRAVNITLGVPLIRTSPSHGTAFDIAWKGIASAEGMIEAIRVAALLT